MRAILASLIGLVLSASLALAAPVDPAQRDAALAVFQAWNKAAAAGRIDDGIPLRSAEMRTRIAADMKTAADRKRIGEMLKSTVPDSVEVLHATQNGAATKLTLYTVISKKVPPGQRREGMPPPGTVMRAEMSLEFLREGGAWKFDRQTWGMDPAKVKPCTTAFTGMEAFIPRDNLSMGGPIRRVAFNADHTLVVIRMLDEENCVFLPSRARLVELGFNPDLLAPYALIEIAAWPHKDDKQAVWAENLSMLDDD